ncbi:interleukin-31 receptor subunit alpha isoform X1 [Equus quagga]|uniref:interleukin-31 receptor subunit alpha isoform X1 n=1 Tax=Equus quagga TaxID=89248 RepID=UPI001EE207E7|nr:interleukin-31 receptor subunit alpha isoform X1 [Equus quagga]XP_046528280.1 interleukin-31 receptor subunit alpha isoform X1 [Equus quagga]XP_046528281.1 interleukin-31 receptor subunit alpha isoform X1 [Equus quagga]
MWAWTLWMLPLLCKFSLAVLLAKPENISCIFYYERNFTCTWSPEKEASDTWYTVKRTYCFGRKSDHCTTGNSTSTARTSCSFYPPPITIPDNYTIQVEAQNADGIIKSDITQWRLDTIVKTEPPEIYSVKPVLGIKRMVQIKWKRPVLAPKSTTLKYRLRFRTVNGAGWMEVNFKEGSNGDTTYNLTGLQAFTEYVVALQCVAEESVFWSGWSQEKMGTTEEEGKLVPSPHGLDLWRVLRPAMVDGRRPVQLLWKKARGAPVLEKTLGYNIQYFPENNTNLTKTVNTTNQQLDLYLGGETYWVSVISYNSLGESSLATLRIPAIDEKPFQCIEAMHSCLTQDQLVVEWQSSASEVDTWMVEWFPVLDSEPSIFSWESVSGARNWTIQQDELKPFWCYNISVYPMLQDQVGEPYSIQAYVKEGIPSVGPVSKVENIGVKTVTITWKEIPTSRRNGFISNYTIFYQAEDGKEFSKTVNSSILQYGLESLTRMTSYTVQVMASTSAGGINGTRINFKTLSISVFEIFLITSLVGGSLLILIIPTVAYGLKKPNKLKHLCWPDVPNPAKSSIAMWRGDNFEDKLNVKEFDDSVNMEEERILKPCSVPSDLIDKLVVDFENFLEEFSTEEPGKGQENILGGEKNEYVTSPYRPYCPTGKQFKELPLSTEIPSRKSQCLSSGVPEGTSSEDKEQLLSSASSLGLDHLCEEGAPNPYLKNSVTTREFLVPEKLPDQTKREV